ncbi:hypothetical protein SCLCIDRAFT_23712 [Scleroderma citrinum Foug A]|uniref:HAT C-terminal dimerisation domain-containing protein n=1 Tax=Scleroderma citrinum Foug A TaxID=1036808 RepID=A0A0C3E6M0_9AGAM|nr:hypothetical protein SCLCIDRAFT_23712 [Scleroderma citrinum Foug A]
MHDSELSPSLSTAAKCGPTALEHDEMELAMDSDTGDLDDLDNINSESDAESEEWENELMTTLMSCTDICDWGTLCDQIQDDLKKHKSLPLSQVNQLMILSHFATLRLKGSSCIATSMEITWLWYDGKGTGAWFSHRVCALARHYQWYIVTPTPVNECVTKEDYTQAICNNPLKKERIKVGNSQGWHKYPAKTVILAMELLRKVATCWHSQYLMVNCVQVLRLGLDYFASMPEWVDDLGDFKLTPTEWLVLSDFEIILQTPHAVQQAILAESQPRLGSTVPTFKLLMKSWEALAKKVPHLKPWIDHGFDVYILTMFIDPTIHLEWIEHHWNADYVKTAEDLVLKMMAKYHKLKNICGPVSSQAEMSGHLFDSLTEWRGLRSLGFSATPTTEGIPTIKQEYCLYTKSQRERGGSNPLIYWGLKHAEFPTLFIFAMDYLPIQASAVLSLQMLKFYLKKKWLNFTEGWAVDYRVLIEDDPEVVELSGAGQELDVSKIKAIINDEEKPLSSKVSIYK